MTVTVTREQFDAAILDMDGVVTDTASVHLEAWRRVFDALLAEDSRRTGQARRPFSDADYRHYVDGRSRYDGAAAFLTARGIALPMGEPSDPPSTATVCGVANRKDATFRGLIAHQGVRVFGGTVAFVRACQAAGLGTAVVSASRSCGAVLASAGLDALFDVRVDGRVAERESLPGKPDPALFLAATDRLGVSPARSLVVEDAEAGVKAGHRGHFALVVGVDRTGHADDLLSAGADTVVRDLSELTVAPTTGRAVSR